MIEIADNKNSKYMFLTNINKKSSLTRSLPHLISLSLVVSILLCYWQVRDFEFNLSFDDDKYIIENRAVLSGINQDSLIWAFSFEDKSKTYWHPLSWLSHMLDVQIYGVNPGHHHLTNVIFHILNAILLFFVFHRMTGAIWRPAFIAALFAVHPVNVESIAWIAERKNVLSTFFWMLTLLAYAYYNEKAGIVRYIIVLFCFVLGLLAKPMIVTLPFVLLLLDYWPLRRFKLLQSEPNHWHILMHRILEKIPLFLLSGFTIYFASSSLRDAGSYISFQSVPVSLRIGNALVSYVKYISKMLWPHNLAVIYPFPKIVPLYQSLGAFLLLVCISILIIAVHKKYTYLVVGWFWFLGNMVPVLGLIQAGLWPAMADRWAYVPTIGLFLIISWGLFDLLQQWRYRELKYIVILLAISVTLMTLSWHQIRRWQSSVTLFQHAVDVDDNNYLAHNSLGCALLSQGKTNEAIDQFKQSLKIDEDYEMAHFNMGVALFKQDRYEEALQFFMKAVQIMPDDAMTYNSIGKTLNRLDKLDKAVANFHQALKIDPDYAEAYNNLGEALFDLGKNEKAIVSYERAIAINPTYTKAYYNLGNLWFHTGNLDKALQTFMKAIKIDPAFAEAYNSAGAAFIKMGEVRKAVAFFRAALKIDPNYVAAQNNLKNTLAALDKSNGKTAASQW